MKVSGKERMLRIIPALWASLLDIGFTIKGQPASYWNGDLSAANERNPIGALFMTNHVSGLFIISALWIGLIILLGYYLPDRLSRIFLLFVLMAHSWAASSWIPRTYFFVGALSLILFNTIFYILMDEFSARERVKAVQADPVENTNHGI